MRQIEINKAVTGLDKNPVPPEDRPFATTAKEYMIVGLIMAIAIAILKILL